MRSGLKLAGALLIATAAGPFSARLQAASRQTLRASLPATARTAPTSRLPALQQLNFVLGLPLHNQEALTNLLQQIYDPASPNYRQYLSPEQFAERFGPTVPEYQALIDFAKSHGFTVTATHPNRTLLEVRASVADIEQVFQVTMRVYQHPTESRTFYAPDVEPSLDLTIPVLSISGLDNFQLPRPKSHVQTPAEAASDPTPKSGSGPGGLYWGNDFRAAYFPGVTLNGTGQVVGLFQFDGYYASDITTYETNTGLPNVTLQNVLLNGFDGNPGTSNVEVALDIEVAIAMAPGLSKVIVYEGTDGNTIINRMATDNAARQLSCSWDFGLNANSNQVFQQFAAQGQSFFDASGDVGAYPATIPDPDDDPYITIVGGTELSTSGPGGTWTSETTWSGSSGGISTTYTIPDWQKGVDMSTNQGSTTKRNIPDVAFIAYNAAVVYDNGVTSFVQGTSIASPLWAGVIALVNQRAAQAGRPPIGFINPAVYALRNSASYGTPFHDITTGNNTNTKSPNKFYAVTGYDLCTGWGTPNGSNLINFLALFAGGVWVDFNYTGGSQTGTYSLPFRTLAQGVNSVGSGGGIAIKTTGASPETMTISKAMTIISVGGHATIGSSTNH